MSSVRRSTRLSSIGQAATPTRTTAALTPRRTEIWRRRQTKNDFAVDSDVDVEEEEEVDNDALTHTSAEENNENCNLINKMERHRSRRSNKPKDTKTEETEPKTPRSSKAKKLPDSRRAMPACRKRELLASKRTADEEEQEQEDDEVQQHESPPKQARLNKTPLPQHLISPTRLLDRLSIDERSEEATAETTEENVEEKQQKKEEEIKDSTPRRNAYQNARRVLNSAETQHLPGRETQLAELRDFFTQHLHEQRSGSLYVSGQPGTGKTACLSLLLREPEFAKRLQCVYINCTSIASVGSVYRKLCAELQLRPNGRTERDQLAAIRQHLRTAPRMLLLVLDEIDQLCSARQLVLYTIFEWPALPDARLLLVGIANSLDLTDRALQRLNARCELKPRLMHFPPYTKQQIVEIFRARLAEAGVLDVFPPLTLQLLAAKVSAVSGDVRRALDIGRRVVEIAEQQKREGRAQVQLSALGGVVGLATAEDEEPLRPVQVTQVAAVLNKIYGASQNLQADIDEDSFPLQQKLMLCSLLLMMRNERHKDISVGRLHEVYRRVCTKRNILALDQAEFAGLVDLVETRGIVRMVRKKEPRQHKVQLQWDEEEVNGALRDKQLIASILDDTACLGPK